MFISLGPERLGGFFVSLRVAVNQTGDYKYTVYYYYYYYEFFNHCFFTTDTEQTGKLTIYSINSVFRLWMTLIVVFSKA